MKLRRKRVKAIEKMKSKLQLKISVAEREVRKKVKKYVKMNKE